MRRRTVPVVMLLAVIAIGALSPSTALAQRSQRGGGGRPHSVVFVGGYFYDPFFGPYPWWGPGMYPYPYFPVYDDRAQVRLSVMPGEAAVYVDGYCAGVVDDFDGALQSLPLSPGAHELTVYLDGYRTVHQRLYLTPRKSYRVRYTMQPLSPGEQIEPAPAAPPVPPPPPGSAMLPRTPRPGMPPIELPPAPAAGGIASGFGTLAVRVQPGDADIAIDGERWTPSQPGERMAVQVSAGRHHIEIRKAGYLSFSTDIIVPAGETVPLNVSLSSQ